METSNKSKKVETCKLGKNVKSQKFEIQEIYSFESLEVKKSEEAKYLKLWKI